MGAAVTSLKSFAYEALTLVSLALFIATICVWSQILGVVW